jgi:hypothetical protein
MKKIMGGRRALGAVLLTAGALAASTGVASATGGVDVGEPCAHYQNNRVMQAANGTWVRCVADYRLDGDGYPAWGTWVLDTGVPGPEAKGRAPAPPAGPCYDPPTPGCPPRGLTPEQRANW